MYVIAIDFNEVVEKANAILSEYDEHNIYSFEYVGKCYL